MEQPAYKRFTSHDGTSLSYRTAGDGRRVVLLHGFTVSSTVNFATHYSDDGSAGLLETAGATVESALVDSGFEVALLDWRGHGYSDKPHDPKRYSVEAFANDVRSLVDHLGWPEAAVVGYSFGAWITERLLNDPWVSRAALCGVGSFQVEGQYADLEEEWAITSKCFLENSWDEHPDYTVLRTWAELSDSDFESLGLVAANAFRTIPAAVLAACSIPVLVLNGGGDTGAADEMDLTPFIPGARRAVAGQSHHGTAPSDPLFQAELVAFLHETN